MIGGRAASDRIIPGRCIISVGNPATELPSGWAWVLLSDLAELGTGHTPSQSANSSARSARPDRRRPLLREVRTSIICGLMTAFDPGYVKTCASRERAELFSPL